jgi:hypothetical protein
MLFSNSTNITGEMGAVATATFDGVGGYVILLIGIVLGFFILERLASVMFPKHYGDKKQNDV